MTFTVTYRGADGSPRNEVVEAAGRAECVAELKARGITPTSIREGRASARPGSGMSAASPNSNTGGSRSRTTVWVAAILAAVVIVAGGVWWWVRSEGADAQERVSPARVEKPATGAKSGKSVVPPKVARSGDVDARGDGSGKSAASPKVDAQERVPGAEAQVVATNKVVKMSPEDEAAFERVKRDTSLRTQVENRMALLATIKPGMPVPPMPPIPNLEQDFEKAEANVITVTEGDTEKDLARKEFVIQLKERISAAKKEGKTATEALNEYVEAMREVADFRQKSLLAARQMERDGDAAAAAKLVDEANAQLREIGAEPIDLHPAPKGKKKKSN